VVALTTIAYDCTLRRPGCALLQAAYGATVSSFDLSRMDRWLLAPTDDLELYVVTDEQLEHLILVTNDSPETEKGEQS
jgi:hypothetical protein